jgi:ectoine hydroxylase-related dioxygenase (phytanoyl-CoA dioxygenase family)
MIDINNYASLGFAVVRNAVASDAIDNLLFNFIRLLEKVSGRNFNHAHSPEVAEFLNDHKNIQSQIYDDIRKPTWLQEFSCAPEIIRPVTEILGPTIGLFRKIPFRIDAPHETAQLAVWHQDYHYVRGNTDVVTAWIPMQDTIYLNGCLMVMPGSHKLGPLEHNVTVLGKRHYPSGVFDREVRYVEMRKGDLLLFHSCLLHSSSFNFSQSIRFSLQARYTRLGDDTDASMGGVMPITLNL